jgi:glycine betaine/choline ABC-type transport system substrate-binding protein
MRGRVIRAWLALALAALAVAVPAGCGDTKEADNLPAVARLIERDPGNAGRPPLAIGSKSFSEQLVLAEIYAQALDAAGYRVSVAPPVADERAALSHLERGRIDAYPEYIGTALTSLYGESVEDVPRDVERAYVEARAAFAEDGLTALPPTPFSNSNGFAMRQEDADTLAVNALSGLEDRAEDLVLSGPPECARRADCKVGLERVYGLRFREFRPVEVALRHQPLVEGEADVGLVFTTDGQIRTENLALLQDDRRMQAPENVTLVVRDRAVRAAGPDLRRIVAAVQRGLTTPVMQELNSRVDLDGETPAAVAYGYLREAGYVE